MLLLEVNRLLCKVQPNIALSSAAHLLPNALRPPLLPYNSPVNGARILRFGTVALLGGWLLVHAALAWRYLDPFLEPGCAQPLPLAGYPEPAEIMLTAADGVTLRAWYWTSRNGAAVIALGGLHGSRGDAAPPAAFLLDAGYGLLQIEGRGCVGEVVTLGAREVLDAEAALDFLLARPEVDARRVGAYGFSMGAAAAIQLAARREEVAFVVAEGGYYNLGEDMVETGSGGSWVEAPLLYAVAGSYWLRTGVNPWSVSPIDDIGLISPRPVFLIYGEHEAASGRAALQFAAAGEPRELWIVPGGAHGTNRAVAGEAYMSRVLGFLAEAAR
jgi:dipeptidyl aminopeptidase/acylaminoacyl peptidase